MCQGLGERLFHRCGLDNTRADGVCRVIRQIGFGRGGCVGRCGFFSESPGLVDRKPLYRDEDLRLQSLACVPVVFVRDVSCVTLLVTVV